METVRYCKIGNKIRETTKPTDIFCSLNFPAEINIKIIIENTAEKITPKIVTDETVPAGFLNNINKLIIRIIKLTKNVDK